MDRGGTTVRVRIRDVLAVYLVGFVAGLVGASIGYSISGDEVGEPGWAPQLGGALGQFGGWAAAAWVLSRLRGSGSLRRDLGVVVRLRDAWLVPAGIALQVVAVVALYPLFELVDDRQDVVDELREAAGPELAVLALTAAVLAPVLEELLFRGLLLRALLARMTPNTAIAVQAVVFAAIHLVDFSAGTLVALPAFAALGVVSGHYAVRTGNLSRSILLHAGFNFLTVVGVLVDRWN